jgi:hypothetical protein
LFGIRQHGGVDVDHDLVPLTGRPRVQLLVQCGLREEDQGGDLVAQAIQLADARGRFQQHGRWGRHGSASFGCPDSTPR